jgi:hypothetical protein
MSIPTDYQKEVIAGVIMNTLEIARKHGIIGLSQPPSAGCKAQIEAFADELQKDNLAKIAVMGALLNEVTSGNDYLNTNWFDARQDILSATKETRDAFIREIEAKALEEAAEVFSIIGQSKFRSLPEELITMAAEKRAK